MQRKTQKSSPSTKRGNERKDLQSSISEPFRKISLATVKKDGETAKVPILVLSGEWLKAVGFPIGSNAYLTTDRRGELALHRLGLGFPRRLRIKAAPR
jgi:hypothetical protein